MREVPVPKQSFAKLEKDRWHQRISDMCINEFAMAGCTPEWCLEGILHVPRSSVMPESPQFCERSPRFESKPRSPDGCRTGRWMCWREWLQLSWSLDLSASHLTCSACMRFSWYMVVFDHCSAPKLTLKELEFRGSPASKLGGLARSHGANIVNFTNNPFGFHNPQVQPYHVADIVAELAGLVFIVGILRPEMPDLLPPEARSMRGASRLLEECSSESVLWNAKVQESSACVVQWFVPSKLLF